MCKVKKHKQTEVKGLEASIKCAGKENLRYEFGDDLVEYEGDSYLLDAAEKRINSLNLPRNVRKDAIYMVDVVVSAEKDFFDGLEEGGDRQFFHDSFVALSEFFGVDNVVLGVVMTNKNPCLHFTFVPVTENGRLSAKDVVSRKVLISLQKHIFETVFKGYGLSESLEKENLFLRFDLDQIRNENSPIRNKNTVEAEDRGCPMVELDVFKNGSDQLKRLDTEFKAISIENASLRDENLELLFEIGDLRDENRALQERIVKLEMKKSQTDLSTDNLDLKRLKKHYEMRGGKG